MKKIVFVCNSGEEGLGHFIRCFNIASALQKLNPYVEIYFDGKYCDFALSKIKFNNFSLIDFDRKEGLYKESIVIFDSYSHNQEKINEISFKSLFSIKIDDFNLYDLSNVDCVINFRANAENENYNSKKTLLGLNFYPAPLSLVDLRKRNISEFKNTKNKDAKNFLIFIGGNDKYNNAKRIIKEFDNSLKGKHLILLSKNIKKRDIVMTNNSLEILNFQRDISAILYKVDAVICGGGLMKYDSGFSLLPCASISQTKDQEVDSKVCNAKNIIYNFGLHNEISSDLLKESILKFVDNSYQIKLKENLLNEYYGNSTQRLAEEIFSFYE